LCALHLKNLGPHGITFLTKVFNQSLATCKIPAIYKTSIVIPLLKPNKPAHDWSSYRPVSLLCPAVKILEACILPILKSHLAPQTHQHGFRSLHSTNTALLEISSAVAGGFNRKKPADRTVLVTLDLSKAFDMVCHRTLLERLSRSTLPPALVRWLSGYLHGRQARTMFRNHLSPTRVVRTGVPQGSVISPTLFNFYIGTLPSPPNGVNVVSYADDVTPYASGPKITPICELLQPYLDSLSDYFNSLNLPLSPDKCTVTLLTPDTKEYKTHPHLIIDNHPLKLATNPKVLGVKFDPMFNFSHHIQSAAAKASRAVNAMKALSGTDWGQSTETLLVTFKALVRPRLEYAAPVWAPVASETSIRRLQTVQNAALRVATGNHRMASETHLHEETKVLPVRAHTNLTSTQHILACHLPHHPGQRLLYAPPPPRNMKPTLLSTFYHRIEPLLDDVDQPLSHETYRGLLRTIHTRIVGETLEAFPPSAVLGTRPPVVNAKEEQLLPRATRRTLTQLRSGYSNHLMTYRARLDLTLSPSCPLCLTAPHTTPHLFNCPSNPTDLPLTSLWTTPVRAAEFLGLLGRPPDQD
jgi:hypothetical protein